MLNYLFPDYIQCYVCNDEIFDDSKFGLCENCYNELEFTSEFKNCILCGRPIEHRAGYSYCSECQKHGRNFSSGISCVIYSGTAERIIMDYKYNDKSYLYKLISDIMISKILEEDIDFDLIVYTPIHITRRLVRGFNQVELIANYLGHALDKRVVDNLIIRRKITRRLKKLSREKREKELKGAFKCNENINIDGKSILLIDDIFTTGSTLNVCAGELLNHGALEVKVITFAVKCNYDYNVYK